MLFTRNWVRFIGTVGERDDVSPDLFPTVRRAFVTGRDDAEGKYVVKQGPAGGETVDASRVNRAGSLLHGHSRVPVVGLRPDRGARLISPDIDQRYRGRRDSDIF